MDIPYRIMKKETITMYLFPVPKCQWLSSSWMMKWLSELYALPCPLRVQDVCLQYLAQIQGLSALCAYISATKISPWNFLSIENHQLKTT